jgi:hypothetical protein
MLLHKTILFALLGLYSVSLTAQTCCSGGVPLASNLGLPSGKKGDFQVGLSYDLNRLRRLYTGAEAFDATSRTRNTQTILLEVSYALTDRISLDAVVPYIQQERIIRRAQVTTDQTSGVGDAVALARYQWIPAVAEKNWEWSSGLGIKLANGASDRANDFGFTFNADLQPGSNAVDFILWNQFRHQPGFRPSMSLFLTTVHRRRGVNDDYLPVTNQVTGERRAQTYQFGTETQLSMGVTDQLFLFGQIVSPGLSLLYRRAAADRTNGIVTPSTGGDFLFLQPTVSLTPGGRVSWQLALDLPVYTKVIGTQVAPTFRLNTGILFSLGTP